MNTLALTAANMGIGGSGIAAVLGYVVVFFGLVLLMCVVILLGKACAPGPRLRRRGQAVRRARQGGRYDYGDCGRQDGQAAE